LQNIARTFNWLAIGPGHFWSLAVEEHFYLLWPAIIFLVYRKSLNSLIVISIFLFLLPLVLRYIMLRNGLEIDVFTFTRLDQLTLGGILAIIEKKGGVHEKQLKYYYLIFILGILLIGFTKTLNYFNLNVYKHYSFGICYFGLIAVIATSTNKSILNRFLSLKLMQYLGKISYGIYVWHVLALDIVGNFLLTGYTAIDFALVILVTILISSISFKFLEKPFLNMKRKFSYIPAIPIVKYIDK
jgi:peptidoglycan/LPS O-acetylase OafA/YrhL